MACDRHPALTCFRGVCCGRGNVLVSMAHSIHHLACSWIDQNSPVIDNRVAAARETSHPSTQPLPASSIRAKAAIYDILFKTWNRDAEFEIAANSKRLGAQISVLHTWGSA